MERTKIVNPCGMRQFETTASTKFYFTRLTQWESVCPTSKKLAVRIHYRVLRTFSSAGQSTRLITERSGVQIPEGPFVQVSSRH